MNLEDAVFGNPDILEVIFTHLDPPGIKNAAGVSR